jgi:hypothetical protein
MRAAPPPALRPREVNTPSLEVAVPRAVARATLLGVREEVGRRVKLGEHPVVVFDIDDTLLSWPTPEHPTRTPVPGALAYVKSLKNAGATIVYMTGRHSDAREATETQLRTSGFPLGRSELLLLRDNDLGTVEYKAAATRAVARTLGTPVAAFDNDMGNARMFRRELPDPRIPVVRLRTTTERPDSGGEGPITVVDDYTPALAPTPSLPGP